MGRNEGERREGRLEGGWRGRSFSIPTWLLRYGMILVFRPLKVFTCLKIRIQIILL